MKYFLTLLIFVATTFAYSAPDLRIEKSVFGSGGMLSITNASGLKLSGLVGQVAIDRVSKDNWVLYQGFWVPTETPTSVDQPVTFSSFITNFPNPASTSTTFRYSLDEPSYVTLKLYDGLGNLIKVLVDEFQLAGEQRIDWNLKDDRGIDVPSGTFVYELIVRPAQLSGLSDNSQKVFKNLLIIVK